MAKQVKSYNERQFEKLNNKLLTNDTRQQLEVLEAFIIENEKIASNIQYRCKIYENSIDSCSDSLRNLSNKNVRYWLTRNLLLNNGFTIPITARFSEGKEIIYFETKAHLLEFIRMIAPKAPKNWVYVQTVRYLVNEKACEYQENIYMVEFRAKTKFQNKIAKEKKKTKAQIREEIVYL